MSLPMMTCDAHHSPWHVAFGLGRKARQLANCVACHAVLDGHAGQLLLTLALPRCFTFLLQMPLPLNAITVWLTRQIGERAEYGFWHDYYETKFQWRHVIDLPAGQGGYEKRHLHQRTDRVVYRHEQYVSDMVKDEGNQWASKEGLDRWALLLATWRVKSAHWWVPDLYDHRFTLRIQSKGDVVEEASLKATITPRICPQHVFIELASTLRPS